MFFCNAALFLFLFRALFEHFVLLSTICIYIFYFINFLNIGLNFPCVFNFKFVLVSYF